MTDKQQYDILVIGGGPAGLAAAISATQAKARVLLIERESRLGGILKQCIHDGFGLIRFREKLSGPEYAERTIEEFRALGIDCALNAFVTDIAKTDEGFAATLVTQDGVRKVTAGRLILATGCRERTAQQIAIHGSRPAGVMTAGMAQHYTNLLGQAVTRRCVILGSGDIGLIMARRLTLEGAEVVGVYEAKDKPSGLSRNLTQCLDDYNIPLHLSHTVTRLIGRKRLKAVEISRVDENMQAIAGTEQIVPCDALILSVGLIPENEIAEKLGVDIDPLTKGPVCDQTFSTSVPGVYACGNALHVNDLVDYVSESGDLAGRAAASKERPHPQPFTWQADPSLLYLVPQKLDLAHTAEPAILYFRSATDRQKARLKLTVNGETRYQKVFIGLKPPEMQRIALDLNTCQLKPGDHAQWTLEDIT